MFATAMWGLERRKQSCLHSLSGMDGITSSLLSIKSTLANHGQIHEIMLGR